jgi:hypothetical protein
MIALFWGVRIMVQRPSDWQKIIYAEAETCYWLAPNSSRHAGTDENADVRRELLRMRTISDRRRQQQIAER